jgi:hypothetical protein
MNSIPYALAVKSIMYAQVCIDQMNLIPYALAVKSIIYAQVGM